MVSLVQGNALSIPLTDKSVQCIITSPPYWGLRSYAGTATWEGGEAGCDHEAARHKNRFDYALNKGTLSASGGVGDQSSNAGSAFSRYDSVCPTCGARRIDAQLGSEPLHDCGAWMPVEHFTGEYREEWIDDEDEDADGNRVFFKVKRLVPVIEYSQREPCGECYLCHMRQVARECWRVLRDDGVMFWNIADSMYSQIKGDNRTPEELERGSTLGKANSKNTAANQAFRNKFPPRRFDAVGLKPKDRCGIPERTALAFQADGWYWRSGITWVKPNPMPESVTDRPTKSTEMVYLFTKAERYYWDAEAVREAQTNKPETLERYAYPKSKDRKSPLNLDNNWGENDLPIWLNNGSRNLRDAWMIATAPYPGQHFATFPPELPRRCIKAGTSERGCCPKCGKPWVRVVDNSEKTPDLRWAPSGGLHRANTPGQETSPSSIFRTGQQTITKTLGWRAACACDAGEPRPCVVLDPFSGAATTGIVARELGRHYVGLELSGEYLQQSRDRLSLTALDEWKGNGKAKAADLSDLPMFARDE